MRSVRPWLPALLVVTGFSLAPSGAHAQQPAPGASAPAAPADPHAAWLDSEPAETFRERVILLALLHDESAGIDPKGYLVKTTKMGAPIRENCWRVQVVTSLGGQEVRRDRVTACKP